MFIQNHWHNHDSDCSCIPCREYSRQQKRKLIELPVCSCWGTGSDNPYCKVHGTGCGCCGGDLTNKACDNHYCSDYDPIAVFTGYKTGENNGENNCKRCNEFYLCEDCDWDLNFADAADAHIFGEYA